VTNNVTSVFTDSLNSILYANLRNQFRYYYSTVILAKSQPVYLFKLFSSSVYSDHVSAFRGFHGRFQLFQL